MSPSNLNSKSLSFGVVVSTLIVYTLSSDLLPALSTAQILSKFEEPSAFSSKPLIVDLNVSYPSFLDEIIVSSFPSFKVYLISLIPLPDSIKRPSNTKFSELNQISVKSEPKLIPPIVEYGLPLSSI